MTDILIAIALIIVGSLLLGKAADWLVSGSSSLALRVGVSSLVVGMTVVAFGTSTPELVTSIMGGPTITLGNVAGSNLMNLGLILGLTALLFTMHCPPKFLRFELPVMAATGPAMAWVCWDGEVTALEGVVLVAGLTAFVVTSVRRGRQAKHVEGEDDEPGEGPMPIGRALVMVVVGIAGLILGGKLLVDGAVELAELVGVPERVVALTLVAGGTSLPELATSFAAARRGHGDLALGNIVGSNVFNILGILGIAAMVRPTVLPPGALGVDVPAVVLLQFACVPLMLTRSRVSRGEGVILLAAYVAYIVLLFVRK